MCGILAAITFDKNFKGNINFKKSLKSINHRGPDYEGYKCFFKGIPTSEGEPFDLFLGHKRLAILDLDERSNQPFTVDHYHIIFNGEIFNYIELREELKAEGVIFSTSSDTEVLLRGYIKYGKAFFSKLNGMWAFIIYNQNDGIIEVCRDRFGIKPLYYMQKGETFYFSSEIKQLKYFENNLNPNREVLGNFLISGLLHYSNESFYEQISSIPTKVCRSINLINKKISDYQYWDFSTFCDFNYTEENSLEQFRCLLLDSLSLRLRTDVPFGALLSGGLDSSAISVLINDHLNSDIQTFSVISDSEKYSEHKFINQLIHEKGLKNTSFDFDIQSAKTELSRVLEVQDEPFASFSVVAQNLLFRKVKSETNITVLLSGQGADEILMGYLKYYFYNLKTNLRKFNILEFTKLVFGALWHKTVFNQFEISQAKRYMPGSSIMQPYIKYEGKRVNFPFKYLKERQIIDINHLSIPALTRYEDRNSMDHSLEVRLPFLDYRLVDFMVNMPSALKIKNGWTKYILRKSVHELPNSIKWRKDKLGFTTPESDWWKGDFGGSFINNFKQSNLEEMGLISKKSFIDSMRSFRQNKGFLSEGDIFRVYITEKWLSKF